MSIIYQPKGKAGEYARYAGNFFNGCSGRCSYCYNRTARAAKLLGADHPTLKKSMGGHQNAMPLFRKELEANLPELRRHGLFFSFVSDPWAPSNILTTMEAIKICKELHVPVITLSKFSGQTLAIIESLPRLGMYGFSLTNADDLEPGTSLHRHRLLGLQVLHEQGLTTWASIEPIINLNRSLFIIVNALKFCRFFRVGLQSGKDYNRIDLKAFVGTLDVWLNYENLGVKVYFKNSFLKKAGLSRSELPAWCVDADYKHWENK
jgi:DNA repair photolyase